MAQYSRLPTGFTNEAFEVVGVDVKAVGIRQLRHWRIWSLFVSGVRLVFITMFLPSIFSYTPTLAVGFLVLWLITRAIFLTLYWTGAAQQDLGGVIFSWLVMMAVSLPMAPPAPRRVW